MAAPMAQATKVFIGGLSWATDDAKLRSYFENFGSVVEAVSTRTAEQHACMASDFDASEAATLRQALNRAH